MLLAAESGVALAPGGPSCKVYLAQVRDIEIRHHALLDERETTRRTRFRVDADRDRFTAATVLLRTLVGRRTGVDAAAVTIDRSCDYCDEPHGRPRLANAGLEASISHSGDVVAVALTTAGRVGVDIEIITARDYNALTPSVCTPAEQEFVRAPGDFYSYWTRKEAVLKATGEGLRTPMTDLVVTPPETAPSLLALRAAEPPPCRMVDLPAAGDYAGAVAVLTNDPVEFAVVDAGPLLSHFERCRDY